VVGDVMSGMLAAADLNNSPDALQAARQNI
jgi:hypothetical protein